DNIGWCLLMMGKPVASAAASRKALATYQKLVDDHPANTGYQDFLANLQTNIGMALDRQKRWPQALPALETAPGRRPGCARAEPKTAWYSRILGASHAARGGARARAGQPAEAAADLRKALELWAKDPHLPNDHQFERSRALALLAGLGADAKSGVTKEEAKAFADPAVAALAALGNAGWAP